MRWPLDSFTISQGFSATHQANDLAAPAGTAIKAPEGGVITAINQSATAFYGGMYIKMRGDSGHSYYLGHCSAIYVSSGQRVSEGQHIGAVGKTGFAVPSQGISAPSGPHIHFEMTKGSQVLDPSKIIPKGEEAMNRDDVIRGFRAILHREPSEAEIKQRTGQAASQFISDLGTSKEWSNQNHDTLIAYPAALKKITQLEAQKVASDPSEAEKKLQEIKDVLGVK